MRGGPPATQCLSWRSWRSGSSSPCGATSRQRSRLSSVERPDGAHEPDSTVVAGRDGSRHLAVGHAREASGRASPGRHSSSCVRRPPRANRSIALILFLPSGIAAISFRRRSNAFMRRWCRSDRFADASNASNSADRNPLPPYFSSTLISPSTIRRVSGSIRSNGSGALLASPNASHPGSTPARVAIAARVAESGSEVPDSQCDTVILLKSFALPNCFATRTPISLWLSGDRVRTRQIMRDRAIRLPSFEFIRLVGSGRSIDDSNAERYLGTLRLYQYGHGPVRLQPLQEK